MIIERVLKKRDADDNYKEQAKEIQELCVKLKAAY